MSKLVPIPNKRATVYGPDIADAICEAIATTPRGIDFLCATHEGFPDPSTVAKWLNVHPEFRQAFEVAKLRQAGLLFDQCLEIADDGSRDTKTITNNAGKEIEVMDFEW